VPIHVLSFLSSVKYPRASWKYNQKLLKIQQGMINETVSNENYTEGIQQQQQHSLFSQASWGRLEMKPERNKFKVQAH